MKIILGTGQLGMAILDLLLKINPAEKILLINRSGKIGMPLQDNIALMAADVTDKDQLTSIAQRAEVIYCCTDVPYQDWGTFYPAIASALAHALANSHARLVFADNMYAYGNIAGAAYREDLPHTATTKKGKIRAGVLHTLLYANPEISQRVAIVKAADFIGPRIHKGIFRTDFLNRLTQGKTIFLFGRTDLPHTFTFIEDFAQAMINVGNAADAFGQIWHVPNASPISLSSWVHLFETETNKKAKIMVLPKLVVRIAGLFDPLLGEFYELAYQVELPYLVNHDKYVARFGNHATNPLAIVEKTVKAF